MSESDQQSGSGASTQSSGSSPSSSVLSPQSSTFGPQSSGSSPSSSVLSPQSSTFGPQSSGSSPSSSVLSPQSYQDDEISLLDILIVLAKHKKLILGLPLLAAVITAGITLLMPNIYTGRAVLMPPQQQQSTAAAMLGQLGALAGVAGSSLGIKNPNDLYVGILKSRTIADALINRFKLKDLYEKDTLVETRKNLAENTALTSGKDGLIIIEVDDEDPKRAADMANAYVEELTKLTQNLAITEASQRRLFFEKQLSQAKDELTKAEVELRKTQERTGMIVIDEQGKATIEAAAVLRGRIAAKEVEMAAMRTFATESNPDYRRTQEELIGLRAQLAKIERNSDRDAGDILMPTGKIPTAGLEYTRKLRDVKYYETIFELMAKQFEMAKIDEARDAAVIQVVDKAVPADRKTKPKRALIVVVTGLLVGFLALFLAFLAEARARALRDPQAAEQFRELQRQMKFRPVP